MTEASNYRSPEKAVRSLTLDRISDLPSNVIEHILTFLPTRDAARTSILSKAWRHRWTNVPQLVFDDNFIGNLQGMLHISAINDIIIKMVYEVLLLHFGPIHKFTLSISILNSCPEIDRLILFVSKKGIQDFNLCVNHGLYKLPLYLFSCSQLSCLSLRSCIFIPPPTFEGFSKLIALEFWEVKLDSNFFENFIPSCPLLEQLLLIDCIGISCLEINSPSLKYLHYESFYNRICFKNAPFLADVTIYQTTGANPLFEGGKDFNLIRVFSCLASLERLRVDYFFLMNLAVPDPSMKLQATLNHIKILEMCGLHIRGVDEISGALCLIRSTPDLQKLLITMYPSKDADTTPRLQLLASYGYPDFYLPQLQEVKLEEFNGTRPELELVKLLLAKASVLKTMHIQPSILMVVNEQLKVLKELIQFRRASLEAEIIFKGLNEGA